MLVRFTKVYRYSLVIGCWVKLKGIPYASNTKNIQTKMKDKIINLTQKLTEKKMFQNRLNTLFCVYVIYYIMHFVFNKLSNHLIN